jgi:uncharacterized peroxidase-related enzyme
MTQFKIHSNDSAPAGSVELLAGAQKAYGFIPNLLGILAESPSALNAYMTASRIFDQSSFSAAERQIVILAASRVNNCEYCVSAHSAIAGLQKVPDEVVEAIRDGQEISDSKLQSLRVFAERVVEKRGWVSDEDIRDFLNVGYTKAQILEVIQGVSFKILSNYINHIAGTPLDDAFSARAWQSEQRHKAS